MGKMLTMGLLSLLAGTVLMVLGHMWALLLFLAGFCLIVAGGAQMFRGAGYRDPDAYFNGLNGQGRQQSEVQVDKTAPQGYQDRPSNIWDQTENK
jgi:hypothetical protein